MIENTVAINLLSRQLSSHGSLAVIMAGLILSGILSCTMSPADSRLLAAASSVAHILISDRPGIKLSRKASMLLACLTVIGIAVAGVFLARDPNSSVFKIVSFAWATSAQASDRSFSSRFSGNGRTVPARFPVC